jgi:hypothetical protein
LCTGRKLVVALNTDYNSILFTKKHKAKSKKDYSHTLAAKFDSENFDGIHMISYLEKDSEILNIGTCTFNVYQVSVDSNWTETLITTVVGTTIANRSIAIVNQIDLNPTELDGEFTLAISCDLIRQGLKFTKKIYVNHLGVYDSIFRLRQDVEFLDITKVDE